MKRGFANISFLLVLVTSVFGMVVASAASNINLPFIMASTDGSEGGEGGDSGGGDGGGSTDPGDGSGGGDEPEEPDDPEPVDPPVDDPVDQEPTDPVLPVDPPIDPIVPLPPTECPEGQTLQGGTCVSAEAKTLPVDPQLPLCDGSPQRCITPGGVICEVGQAGHECECAEDMSDCPKHPSLPVVPDPVPKKPLPYCDKVKDDPNYTGSCHDRKDYDEITGLYPCNDGSQEKDWRDCEDAYVPPPKQCDPKTDPNCEPVICPANMTAVEGGDCIPSKCKDGYRLVDGKCVKEDDDDERYKIIIKNINIYETIHNTADFPEVDVIGLSLKNTGEAMVCIMNIDNDWVQCQKFGVPNDGIDENIWRVIETDSNKDYDNGNTGSKNVDDAINGIKSQAFTELDTLDNHDFQIDLAALGINPQGDGLVCLIEDDRNEGTALCEPFKDVDGCRKNKRNCSGFASRWFE